MGRQCPRGVYQPSFSFRPGGSRLFPPPREVGGFCMLPSQQRLWALRSLSVGSLGIPPSAISPAEAHAHRVASALAPVLGARARGGSKAEVYARSCIYPQSTAYARSSPEAFRRRSGRSVKPARCRHLCARAGGRRCRTGSITAFGQAQLFIGGALWQWDPLCAPCDDADAAPCVASTPAAASEELPLASPSASPKSPSLAARCAVGAPESPTYLSSLARSLEHRSRSHAVVHDCACFT